MTANDHRRPQTSIEMTANERKRPQTSIKKLPQTAVRYYK